MTDNRALYETMAREIAYHVRIDPDTFCRQITQESGWNPRAVSPSGAEGLGQLMPRFYPFVDRFDPEQNLRAAAETMRVNLDIFDGDMAAALGAYNGGKVGISRWIAAHPGNWRRALTDHADDWPAEWGGAAKARQVAAYLDAILGSQQEEPTVNPPETTWIGSPNHWAGRRGLAPIAIVDHIMEGTLSACDSWFRNPASEVSAHFGVGRDGTIHQYVKVGDTAWANGRVNQPNRSIRWLVKAVGSGVNPNLITISIEHEGRSGDAMPEAQYQATLALHRWLCADWGIPADNEHIIGHGAIDSVNKAHCPGAGFPWARLFADMAAQAPKTYTVDAQTLDGVWHIAGLIESAHPAEADELRRLVGVIKG